MTLVCFIHHKPWILPESFQKASHLATRSLAGSCSSPEYNFFLAFLRRHIKSEWRNAVVVETFPNLNEKSANSNYVKRKRLIMHEKLLSLIQFSAFFRPPFSCTNSNSSYRRSPHSLQPRERCKNILLCSPRDIFVLLAIPSTPRIQSLINKHVLHVSMHMRKYC
jgi:hypothetical protein